MIHPARIARALYDRFDLKAARGPIGIALAGIGGWGGSNATSIMRSRRFNIIGVCDVNRDAARRFSTRYATACYDTLDTLLEDPAVRAVCITVPNHLHVEMVKACADAGKHIFVEKPLASTPDACDELGACCSTRGVLLQVGQQMRREPVFREIKRMIDRGELGTPLFAQGVYTLERRQRSDWRTDSASCPGGSMEQLGIHLIDVLLSLFGPPGHVQGARRRNARKAAALDWRYVEMEFACGARATVSSSFSSPGYLGLELYFDRGRIFTDGISLWVGGQSGKMHKTRPRGTAGSVLQFAEFADCIEKGGKPETGAAEARIVMNIIQSVHGA